MAISLIILSYTIDFCFSLQSYYSGTKCELRQQALFVSEKIRVTRRWRWRCQRMPKTLWETVWIWKEMYVAIHTMTCIHTYIQPESYFMIEKKMAASSGLSCPGQNIPWGYTSLLVFILYLLSAHNLASHLFCLQGKNVLVTTTGAWWSLWQFWLFLSTQSPFSCTCVPREFSEHGSDSLGVFNFETLPCWGFWTWWVKNKHHHQQNPFLSELTKNSWHVACWSPENIPILPLTLQNSVGM